MFERKDGVLRFVGEEKDSVAFLVEVDEGGEKDSVECIVEEADLFEFRDEETEGRDEEGEGGEGSSSSSGGDPEFEDIEGGRSRLRKQKIAKRKSGRGLNSKTPLFPKLPSFLPMLRNEQRLAKAEAHLNPPYYGPLRLS